MRIFLIFHIVLQFNCVTSTLPEKIEKKLPAQHSPSILQDSSTIIQPNERPSEMTKPLSPKDSKRTRPKGYFTKESRIKRLMNSINIEKPHLGKEGAYIAAKDAYRQKSRKQNERYREKRKLLGISMKDTRKRDYKSKQKDYYSTENVINRKAFSILKSKENRIVKFHEARQEAKEIIEQRKAANRTRMREKHKSQTKDVHKA